MTFTVQRSCRPFVMKVVRDRMGRKKKELFYLASSINENDLL